MRFWSDWLLSVTRHASRAPTPAAPTIGAPGAAAPLPGAHAAEAPLPAREPVERATLRVEARAQALRLSEGRTRERRATSIADRAPRPAIRSAPSLSALPVVDDDARADDALPDLAPIALHAPVDRHSADPLGQWQVRVFDLVSDGMLLFGAGGELAYRNAAAAAMTTDDAGLALLREARALALAVLAQDEARRAQGRDAVRELTLGTVRFRLSAVPVPASLPSASLAPATCAPAVLVAVARTSPALPSPATLRRRFQLTAREASVALLLAEGRSNAGVARRLGISANTVRHYIETVLLKLDVPSRAAVAAALLGVYEHTDEHALPRGPRARHAPAAD